MASPSEHRCSKCGAANKPLLNCSSVNLELLCFDCRHQLHHVPPYRRTGRTTRTLWRALLHASEHDGAYVVVFVDNARLADWTYRLLLRLSDPLEERFMPVGGRGRRLVLPNASTVEIGVVPRRMSDEARYHGIRNLWTATDHAI